jgi:UDP-N-acetylglucosamine:LPS N-acetylglucosamine transferase
MKICFLSISGSGHIWPYLKFVEALVSRGHTVDWYGADDKAKVDMSEKILATGAKY